MSYQALRGSQNVSWDMAKGALLAWSSTALAPGGVRKLLTSVDVRMAVVEHLRVYDKEGDRWR